MNIKEKIFFPCALTLLQASLLITPLTCFATETNDAASAAATESRITATSEAEALKQFSSLLDSAGIHYTLGGKNLTITIQEDKALTNASEVQAMGAIDSAVSATEMKQHPVEYASKVGLFYAIAIVQYLYLTPQTNELHVSVDLVSQEDGSAMTHQIAAFDFTRSLNGKINYDKLNADTMPTAVPNFKYSEWYNQHK